jgi:hypothetical protein
MNQSQSQRNQGEIREEESCAARLLMDVGVDDEATGIRGAGAGACSASAPAHMMCCAMPKCGIGTEIYIRMC